jgi:hypothetical protein
MFIGTLLISFLFLKLICIGNTFPFIFSNFKYQIRETENSLTAYPTGGWQIVLLCILYFILFVLFNL